MFKNGYLQRSLEIELDFYGSDSPVLPIISLRSSLNFTVISLRKLIQQTGTIQPCLWTVFKKLHGKFNGHFSLVYGVFAPYFAGYVSKKFGTKISRNSIRIGPEGLQNRTFTFT